MKRILVAILSVVSSVVAFGGVHYWMTGDTFGLFNESPEISMRKEADRINPMLPKMIDQITRLDHVAAGPGNRFTYEYTLTSPDPGVISPDKIEEYRRTITANVCSSLAEFRRAGTLVIYRYKSTQGDQIAEIQVATVDCPK